MSAFAQTFKNALLPRWLLVFGLMLGTASTAFGLLNGFDQEELSPQAVALINHRAISSDAWLRAVAAVASERHVPLTQEDKRHILDRLIDEELLVQHAIALRLPEQDARIRSQLVSEIMQATTAAAQNELDDAALRRFYQDNQDIFTEPIRLRIAVRRLDANGNSKEFQPSVPNALLPPAKLQTYVGPVLTAKAMSLPVGVLSEPIGEERIVLTVLERRSAPLPSFEQVKEQVKNEARRRADETAVRTLLTELRADNKVTVRANLP